MFLSLLIILIIVAVAGAWFLLPGEGDDSQAMLQGLSQIRSLTGELVDEEEPRTATIYKWRDAAGEWHFSNTPPPEGMAVEIKTYRTDTNVIQATRPPAARPAPAAAKAADAPAATPDLPGLPAPDKVKKLMDDVQAIRDSSENRTQILDRQIDASQ